MRRVVPYVVNEQLPPAVRDHLPLHAQDIFREAFNHAFEQGYPDEASDFRIGWAAVKRQYQKVDGYWGRRR